MVHTEIRKPNPITIMFVLTYIKFIFALREAFGRELIISLVQNAMNNHNLHNKLYAICALTDSTR